MQNMQNMQDPSQGVHRELLPHLHLLSTFRYQTGQSIHHNKIAEWLLQAPRIARDQAPFFWTFLDRPTDGTVLLTWQPLDALGTNFASDGYAWPPQEAAFSQEIEGGYVLEMFQHKSGYAPGEHIAAHSRRRYRLLPSRVQPPVGPVADGSLWITHYSTSEPADQIPSHIIPATDMRTRMALQAQGQIVQKEFMLHDRTNWPQIQFPRGARAQPLGAYMGGPSRTPQAMAYPTQATSAAGPPAKRARTQANAVQTTAAVVAEPQDDEEDTSRGDLFDHLTPREISVSRYKQNHEWLEEVVSSHYSVSQIIPVDLGLGLRGELNNLTEGVFHPPSGNLEKDPHQHAYVGRLDSGKADEFRKRANERIVEITDEIEKMKAKHARRMAKFKKGGLIITAEKELRTASHDPSDVGPEYWRLEGKIDDDDEATDDPSDANTSAKVDDIVAQVEASLGRHIAAVHELTRIQDGGLEEGPVAPSAPASVPGSNNGSQHSGVLVGDADLEMGDSAAGLLDQYHQTDFSSTSTPAANNFPTPQPMMQAHSSANTPLYATSPQPPVVTAPQISTHPTVEVSHDAMEGVETSGDAAKDDGMKTGDDWVVVPEGGISPPAEVNTAISGATGLAPAPVSVPMPLSTLDATAAIQSPTPEHADLHMEMPESESFSIDPSDFAGLEDLDTAGDALAGYGEEEQHVNHDEPHSDMGGMGGIGGALDMGMDLGMEDSAFGDALHGTEMRDDEGEGEGGI